MSNEKQTKINIFKILGLKLIENGIWFLKTAFHLKLKKTSRSYIKSFLISKGMPLNKIFFADPNYFYTDINTMKDIIFHDWTDREKYEKDKNDCDDFAFRFKSHMQERYKITAVALCKHIELLDPETGKHLNFHRANVFFADENNVMKLWFLEPQTDNVVEVKDYTEFIRLTGWLNKLNIFDF